MRMILLSISIMLFAGCKSIEPLMKAAAQHRPPTQSESSLAIREALNKGISASVSQLGKKGGFSGGEFKIPLPNTIQGAADKARQLGLGRYVDQFEMSVNDAAEQAVPLALDVFKESIRQMTLKDVIGIVKGPNDAATQYFRRTSADKLKQQFLPIVNSTTSKVGVTEKYKKLSGKLKLLGAFSGVKMPAGVDLNEYIVEKTTDALFQQIAKQEQLIRREPMVQTSALLRKVFGYYSKNNGNTDNWANSALNI